MQESSLIDASTFSLPSTAVWIIVALLSTFFVFSSTIKMFAWQRTVFDAQMEFMRLYGISRQLFFGIGVIELLGAFTIWYQQSLIGLIGICLLGGTSIVAFGFHVRFDSWRNGIPAMVTAVLSGVLFLQNIDVIGKMLN